MSPLRRFFRRLLCSVLYRRVVRPLLFRLPPEAAMGLGASALRARFVWKAGAPSLDESRVPVSLPRRLSNSNFNPLNPIGLAAGLDKRCDRLDSLACWGFGYVIGGTVTALRRDGNEKPRLLRDAKEESVINALGFPSDGLDAAVERLERRRPTNARVLVSVAALNEQEAAECLRRLEPVVDGVEVNISSPNTAGLRRFHEPEALRGLLGALNAVREKPLFVKIPPYKRDDDEERERVLRLVGVCREEGVDAVTAANTIPVENPRLAAGRGGLSGRPILEHMLAMLPEVRSVLGADIGLNACGGVASAEDARKALDAGANTVQLYTALIFQGPGLVEEVCAGLRTDPAYGAEPRAALA